MGEYDQLTNKRLPVVLGTGGCATADGVTLLLDFRLPTRPERCGPNETN